MTMPFSFGPIEYLTEAFAAVLGKGEAGSIAFVRCLPGEWAIALALAPEFQIDGWEVHAVSGKAFGNGHVITADKAVEIRENKGAATLLLVDGSSAGAGMDGIYNAAREIFETELFSKSIRAAQRTLPKSISELCREAVRRARRLGRRHSVSPRQEFEFYARCAPPPHDVGAALPLVGLWPTHFGNQPDSADLARSALLVEKLLLQPASAQPRAARIAGLMLEQPSQIDIATLDQVLRAAAGQPLGETLNAVVSHQALWLNRIRPAFSTGRLAQIKLIPWRGPKGAVLKWSGLHMLAGEDLPQLTLNRTQEDCHLEVRWNTVPEEIAKSAVNYEVAVVAAGDILAAKPVAQGERSPQKLVFTIEDFEDLGENSKFHAQVVVKAIDAEGVVPVLSEEFIIVFGEAPPDEYIGSGETVRCVAEGAISSHSFDDVRALVRQRGEPQQFRTDDRNYIIVHSSGAKRSFRSFRIFRPKLIKDIETRWGGQPDRIGRWSIQVRPDGPPAGELQFHPIDRGTCPEPDWQKLLSSTKRFCEDTVKGPGVLSRLYLHGETGADIVTDYINHWTEALERGDPALALAHTLEVRDISSKTVGLIVLPMHPVRVAWQAAYDALAARARYEDRLSAAQVKKALFALDSSHFPAMLPGLEPGTSFLFGDTLGLVAVAMVKDTDREPKAAISTLALCLGADQAEIAPSVGYQTAAVLAREIQSYLQSHQGNRLIHLNALRPGDGATIVRALGLALKRPDTATNDDERLESVAFALNLHPSTAQQAVAGRFLTKFAERRRSGSGGIEKDDAWLLEPLTVEGGRVLPRLRWSRRTPAQAPEPAHLSLAFDTFASQVVAQQRMGEKRPLHAFGLVAHLERRFSFLDQAPVWESWVSPEFEGEKHPSGRLLSDRLQHAHATTLRAVARALGSRESWPVLRTILHPEQAESLQMLHRHSDWVVTLDRNAGIEYFDSPRQLGTIYETYVIDAVPERDDLGCLQMITSTCHLEEVRGLLDQTLTLMGLSNSLGNCEFLLGELKALSGRLAMRLTSGLPEAHARVSGELVALSLARAHCRIGAAGSAAWLSLAEGCFVPLDDIRDLWPKVEPDERSESSEGRADLLYLSAPARGGLTLRFVEVKYRRHLALARSQDLLGSVVQQTSNTRRRWLEWYFDPGAPAVIRALRASRLGRALRFYLEKARRHYLSEDVAGRLAQELDRLLLRGTDYQLTEVAEPDRGYIFCPDYTGAEAERLPFEESGETAIYLFGAAMLPDVLRREATPTPRLPQDPSSAAMRSPSSGIKTADPEPFQNPPNENAVVLLGTEASGEAVRWTVSIRGNPHLMIAGLPGMGKTTCLVNICRQLQAAAVSPIVFSYHDDIDEKLATFFPSLATADCQHLGFNPMRVTAAGPLSHIESAGLLRDIFASIFPDLGDLQLETLRAGIKSSYEELGWGGTGGPPPIPKFRTFLEKLLDAGRSDSRTKTLLARLMELDDFRFFSDAIDVPSLLDERRPAILQIHKTMNEAVQRAFASFAFYRIYQDMFRRGRQETITHAVIFDEAHRAHRLKLIPTMAKECRKYGLALILASQEARDFDSSLYSAIANYLILRVTENDARALARNVAPSDLERRIADRLKQMPKFQALYFCEGRHAPTQVQLAGE